MKTIRSFYLWTIGILFFGCSALLLALLLSFIPAYRLYPLVRKIFRFQMAVVHIGITVRGQDQIDVNKSYLVMGNHESLFDIFILPVAIPFYVVAVEAAYHFKLPIWGYLIKRWGCLPIHRRDRAQAIGELEKVAKVIHAGTSVLILPEGHRTMTGQIGPFKKGPFHCALATKAPILPFALKGLYGYKSKHSWQLNPTTVEFTFGPPIPYCVYGQDSVEELRARIRNAIIDLKGDP